MTVLIPDFSEWQGPPHHSPGPDMAAVKKMNGGAAVLRAADGDNYNDHIFGPLRAAARKASYGFLGIYQYIEAAQPIAAQAARFIQLAGKLGPHEVPIADLETGTGSQAARWQQWADQVEAALGRRPWLYSGASFAVAHGLAPFFYGAKYHTWVAAYGAVEPALGHTLWQSTNGVTGANITDWPGAGKCDTSIYHGTFAQLAALITSSTPPPKTSPPSAGGHMHVTAGQMSIAEIAHQHGITPAMIISDTARFGTAAENAALAGYVDDILTGRASVDTHMPGGLHIWLRQ